MFRDYAHRAEVFRAAVARVAATREALVKPARRRRAVVRAATREPAAPPRCEARVAAPSARAAASRVEAGALDVWAALAAWLAKMRADGVARAPDPAQRGGRRSRARRRRAGAGGVRRW